jgi:hypothetical protein
MLKKTLLAAAVASTIAAAPAYAALTQTVSGEITYAAEIFGTGSDATTLVNGATVVLTTGADIATGEKAQVTYTLTGGTFGSAVDVSDFSSVFSASGAYTASVLSGGAIGDSAVTIEVTVTSDLAATDTFVLAVDNLQDASGLATAGEEVTVATTIALITTGGVNQFPSTVATVTDEAIADSATNLGWTVTDGTNASIDINARATFAANQVVLTEGTDTVDSVEVADVTFDDSGTAVIADGTTAIAWGADDEITLSLSGKFNSGDRVILSGDTTIDSGEEFTIAGDTATKTIDAADLTNVEVYYIPNGTDTLSPATFTLTATSAFDDATYVVQTSSAGATTSYSGLTENGYALAVPPSSSSDIANIRVLNETAADNIVFAQAYAADGTDLGFEELGTISANATQRWTATDLEGVFGTWTGRARFEFSTSGDASVQTLIRSGGILNNIGETTDRP